MGKTAKKIFDVALSVIMTLVVIFAFLLAGVRLFGLTPYTVLSGSMEPTYHVGSVIYVKKVNPYELKAKDPITYVIDGKTVVTHRIERIIYDENDPTYVGFITKGDNNDHEDGEPVLPSQIIGKPVFSIPVIGYVVYFIQRPPWNAVAIGILAVLLIFAFVPDIIDKLAGADGKKQGDEEKGAEPAQSPSLEKDSKDASE